MGVDYYNCEICGEIFNDCGDFGYCGKCGIMLCSGCHDSQVEKYGKVEPDSQAAISFGDYASCSCDKCSGVIVSDEEIILYLLALSGKKYDDVIAEIKSSR